MDPALDKQENTAEELEKEKILQRIEQEHRYALNTKAKESSMQKMLEQPFQPPALYYERKPVAEPEKALILKHQAKLTSKGATKAQ